MCLAEVQIEVSVVCFGFSDDLSSLSAATPVCPPCLSQAANS